MNDHWNGFQQPPVVLSPASAPTYASPDPTAAMLQLVSRVDYLIRLMEDNNQLLRSIEQQQSRVATAGSGSVIVRM